MLTDPHIYAPDGHPWNITTLINASGMRVTFMDWGATWLSARIPMKDGSVREALLGCDTPADYLCQQAYLGATVGRYANRIANAILPASPHHPMIKLVANQGEHQLHGGPKGFHARRWKIEHHDDSEVIYSLFSPDGDQGFPGNLRVTLRYRLEDDNTLSIQYQAAVDQHCPVSLTNHAYFNLDQQHNDSRQHQLKIIAEHYLPVDSEGIPVDGLKSVAGSSFDFRQAKSIAQDFLAYDDQRNVKGYDHAFC
ncbi:MAG: Aldose 1-epimerase [Candidatus Erwinia impunctatus]|nr:Aldose 1-epimerase [Culicoides impunctatus]